jgi:tRNA pseudouridine32 synthase/23S rRNA pseudouridine746 synthase
MGPLIYFDPPPRPEELPARLPSPFAPGPPHPLARRAAAHLQERLRRAPVGPEEGPEGPHRGKMFGVLVVLDRDGRAGYLAGFSGMLEGRWEHEGFVGPLFDAAHREATWPPGEAELMAFDRQIEELSSGAEAVRTRGTLEALDDVHTAARAALAAAHEESRADRRARRDQLGSAEEARAAALHALAQESRADTAEERRLRAAQLDERAPLLETIRALEERRRTLQRRRGERSNELLEVLFAGYLLESARGERRSLRALFAPASPPGGSGDCAAPKLFGHALRAGLRPVALAEFWWGPPSTGGRRTGSYYPSCRGKCGPVLAHLLDGLPVEPAPIFGADEIAPDEPRTVFEDGWLLVVDKPVGLLSVPGRSGLRDSVLTRLRERHPGAEGPLLVHRLDLDTSGLMIAAKDPETHHALQRQFFGREIEKRYVAWLEGTVAGDRGTIDLALRVDIDDRPRQIHDPVHGKGALTEWTVLTRAGARTRVALQPRTGRTHQLRVHAAHPLGLSAPIVGDRLYGNAGDERLMLHAESLAFTHPRTQRRLTLDSPAPF